MIILLHCYSRLYEQNHAFKTLRLQNMFLTVYEIEGLNDFGPKNHKENDFLKIIKSVKVFKTANTK